MTWLWWLVLTIAGIACLVYAGFALVRNHLRKATPAQWARLLNAGALREFGNAEEIVAQFFKADLINPAVFVANLREIYSSDLESTESIGKPANLGPPSPTAIWLRNPLYRPMFAYPTWYMSAYPDVVTWLIAIGKSENMNLAARVAIETVHGAQAAQELLRDRSAEQTQEILRETLSKNAGGFTELPYLRRLIDIFKRETGKRLECAV